METRSHGPLARLGYFSLWRITAGWALDEGDLFYYHKRWWPRYARVCQWIWPHTLCRLRVHHVGYKTTDWGRMVIHRRGHAAMQQTWVGTCTWCKRVVEPPHLSPPATDVVREAQWDQTLGKWV